MRLPERCHSWCIWRLRVESGDITHVDNWGGWTAALPIETYEGKLYPFIKSCGSLTTPIFVDMKELHHIKSVVLTLSRLGTCENEQFRKFSKIAFMRKWKWSQHFPEATFAQGQLRDALYSMIIFCFQAIFGNRAEPIKKEFVRKSIWQVTKIISRSADYWSR